MKYIFLIFLVFGFGLNTFGAPSDCSAAGTNVLEMLEKCRSGNAGIDQSEGEGVQGIREKATIIGERAIAIGALFAIGALVWSGIQYNSSFGDDEKIKHAKNTMIYALIGLVILMMSFPFVNIVIDFVVQISG